MLILDTTARKGIQLRLRGGLSDANEGIGGCHRTGKPSRLPQFPCFGPARHEAVTPIGRYNAAHSLLSKASRFKYWYARRPSMEVFMLTVGCTCGCSVHVWPCPWAANPVQVVSSPTPMQGWICPVCHGGNSPFAVRCPCVPAHPPIHSGVTINGVPQLSPLPPNTIITSGQINSITSGSLLSRMDASHITLTGASCSSAN